MKGKLHTSFLLAAMLVALASNAMGSTTWYVSGVSGDDSNNCMSPTSPCKTIGRAISLAASGDIVTVAAATYTETLSINIIVKVIGSGASTTIIDGGGIRTVVAISNTAAQVTLSNLTIRNGKASSGGGISNSGTMTQLTRHTDARVEQSIRRVSNCSRHTTGLGTFVNYKM
jgi:Protein of unknown function (DUF1565)